MGQKLSHLRGLFRVMDNDDGDSNVSSEDSSVERPDNLVHGSAHRNSRSETVNNIIPTPSHSNNGNVNVVEEVDDIFEHIYNSHGAENLLAEEENGNVVGLSNNFVSDYSSVCRPTISTSSSNRTDCACDRNAACREERTLVVSRKRSEESGQGSSRRSSARALSLLNSKRSRTKLLRGPKETCNGSKKKRNNWVMKFNCARLKNGSSCGGAGAETDIPEPNLGCDSCVCTGYRRTEEHHLGAGVVFEAAANVEQSRRDSRSSTESDSCAEDLPSTPPEVLIDMSKFNPEDFPIEDCDERARLERAREIAEGVEPPPGFCPGQHIQLVVPPAMKLDNLTALFQTRLTINVAAAATTAVSQLDVSLSPALHRGVHTQVDYIHCLVPDLLQITSCSFYWGKMDRYEAERLLEGRPEGTFLLRDSAQEEYLFSVSFRKYGRSLHARIEQWNHHFSFDSHDPGVFASPTVCGLIEHYKDPSCCMFFEPMLTIPLHRNFPFPLQHLCRAVVCSKASYDGVNQLQLPKALKGYLKEYHYKQRVRVRVFDSEP